MARNVSVNCSEGNHTCALSSCWRPNATYPAAYVLVQPSYIWVPSDATDGSSLVSILSSPGKGVQLIHRHKRDFGVSAAIAAIIVAITAATAATVATVGHHSEFPQCCSHQ